MWLIKEVLCIWLAARCVCLHGDHYNHAVPQLFYIKLSNWFTSLPVGLNSVPHISVKCELKKRASVQYVWGLLLYLQTLMFPLPFWRVFIRSIAATRAPADIPQLFKEVWMPGWNKVGQRNRAGKMKGAKRKKEKWKRQKETLSSSCQTHNKWRGWHKWNDKSERRRVQEEAETEGGGRVGNKHRVPFLCFTLNLNLHVFMLDCMCNKAMSQFKKPTAWSAWLKGNSKQFANAAAHKRTESWGQ